MRKCNFMTIAVLCLSPVVSFAVAPSLDNFTRMEQNGLDELGLEQTTDKDGETIDVYLVCIGLEQALGLSTDNDGDGILSAVDNCPGVFNPGQEQTNNKGVGDACNFAGDLDGSGAVNCVDIEIVKFSFIKRCGQDGYDFRADTNEDCVIDVSDLAFVSQQLPAGTTCPENPIKPLHRGKKKKREYSSPNW